MESKKIDLLGLRKIDKNTVKIMGNAPTYYCGKNW
jgi:hypothetical protein